MSDVISVLGDNWHSVITMQSSTAKGASDPSLPTFEHTSTDTAIRDGACLTARLMDGFLKGVGAVHTSGFMSEQRNRLITLGEFPSEIGSSRTVRRIRSIHYLKTGNTEPAPKTKAIKKGDRVIVDVVVDDNGEWRSSGQGLREIPAKKGDPVPVVVVLGSDLPMTKGERNVRFKAKAWNKLFREVNGRRRDVTVVLSASLLRLNRADVSRRLSWDRSIEDLCYELEHDDRLKLIHKHASIVVRFGMSAAAWIERGTTSGAHFVYSSDLPRQTQRDAIRRGRVGGKSAILAACVVKKIAADAIAGKKRHRMSQEAALKFGLGLMRKRFEAGYCDRPSKSAREHVFGRKLSSYKSEEMKDECRTISACQLPSTNWNRYDPEWSILRVVVPQRPTRNSISRVNLAEAIVLAGVGDVLNCDEYKPQVANVLSRDRFGLEETDLFGGAQVALDGGAIKTGFDKRKRIDVPLLTIGKYSSVERSEIECLQSIRNLVMEYIGPEGANRRVPLSIAVFGRPGSGKSFAVRELALELSTSLVESSSATGLPILEFNLAQLTSPHELSRIMEQIRDENIKGNVPFVLFDEFDCFFDGNEYGWLKYLLAPMQDGKCLSRDGVVETGRAVFAFAGGTAQTFADFSAGRLSNVEVRSTDAAGDAALRRQVFVAAKGPDFVSRLRGFVDVKSLNPEGAGPKPVIRRALLLRGLLHANNRVREEPEGFRHALIDEDIVFALLTISRFRHESRSMQAIIEMASPLQGWLTKSSLPSQDQLSMHLDANEFYDRMRRSRRREKCWPD